MIAAEASMSLSTALIVAGGAIGVDRAVTAWKRRRAWQRFERLLTDIRYRP